jgi:CheY-like chemotaxis protein
MTTVLVADDDEGIRNALQLVCDAEGYTAHFAADGRQALDVLHHSREPLVVVLDYKMPHLDGLGFLETVRRQPSLAGRHRYVLMTAMHHTFPLALLQLVDALHIPLLLKPFHLDDLLGAITQAAASIE